MKGVFKIRIPKEKQLVANTVLKVRSYIIDDLQCGGPEYFSNVTGMLQFPAGMVDIYSFIIICVYFAVPDFLKAEENVEAADFDLVSKIS